MTLAMANITRFTFKRTVAPGAGFGLVLAMLVIHFKKMVAPPRRCNGWFL